jgi:putative hydrolase of the HAD superfamily
MSSFPKAILFDLDDTIISAYGRPDVAWLEVCTELADIIAPLTPVQVAASVARYAQTFWADPDRHRQWRQDIKSARREVVRGAMLQMAADGHATFAADVTTHLADRFSAYRDEQMFLFPDAHATLDALRSMGILLALITNGDGPGQRRKIERFELAHRFHHIQIEGERGFGKPDERAYRFALETLDAGIHESWIVGDNLEWEVAVPQRLGIFAVWYDHLGQGLPADVQARPDATIRKLTELRDKLGCRGPDPGAQTV